MGRGGWDAAELGEDSIFVLGDVRRSETSGLFVWRIMLHYELAMSVGPGGSSVNGVAARASAAVVGVVRRHSREFRRAAAVVAPFAAGGRSDRVREAFGG